MRILVRIIVWLSSWLPRRRREGPVSDYKYPSE